MTVLYTFSADLNVLPQLLEHIQTAAFAQGMDRSTILRAQTAVEELFTNSVRHGYPNRADAAQAQVWLDVRVDAGRLTLRYQDSAPPFDPLSGLEGVFGQTLLALDDRPVGGLGRLLVKRLADEASYSINNGLNQIDLVFEPRPKD